ncbi:amino acid transporter [Nannochloropsis oceanica]
MPSSGSPRDPHLTLLHLWGVSVGAAIGGNFVGWNSTLAGGLGGALLGLFVATILYMTLSLCIAEMSAHTLKIGGSHTFVGESPLGRLGAYLCGVAELLKIIPTGSVCVFAIASYVGHAVTVEAGQRHLVEVGIWFVSYGVFTLLNLMGVEISVNFQVATTIASIAVLISFYLSSPAFLDFDKFALLDMGQDGWFLGDVSTIWISLPYSLWWYLGIESVPLLAGSVSNPAKVMPKAIIISMATLAATAILTLILSSSVAPGVASLANSSAPLLDGFKALTDNKHLLFIVSALVSLGLIVSFHCFVLYAGETVAVLATDGILPACLGATHPRYNTPHVALIGSSTVGLGLLALTVSTMSNYKAVSVLINLAVVGGLVAYILQFLAYVSRPWASTGSGFRSPLGRKGAYVGLGLCVMLLGCEFYHATVEIAEAEGLLVSMLVFVIAIVVYWFPCLNKSMIRKRTPSSEGDEKGRAMAMVYCREGMEGDGREEYRINIMTRLDLSSSLHSFSSSLSTLGGSGNGSSSSVGNLSSPQRRRGIGGGAASMRDSINARGGVASRPLQWCDV